MPGAPININIDGKAVTTFIEKVSAGIGALWEPRQMVRKALAEAEVQRLAALAKIDLDDMQRRALKRLSFEEARKQQNMEQIADAAIPLLLDSAEPEKIENDWMTHFFERCRLTSDEEMQALWSKLLAGEANRPGTFSKRTVEAVAAMDKRDAEQFQKVCSFSWEIGVPTAVIFNLNSEFCVDHGITFDLLHHLEAVGLLTTGGVGVAYVLGSSARELAAQYDKQWLILSSDSNPLKINVGKVRFTQIGRQLARIVIAERTSDIMDHTTAEWIKTGLNIRSLYPQGTLPEEVLVATIREA